MSDFAALKASIARPRSSVRLCLRGDLFAERDRVVQELAREAAESASLAGSPVVTELRDRLTDLDLQMDKATHVFTFEAVPRSVFADLEDAYPPNDEGGPSKGFFVALVAATLVEPDLTADQVGELFDDLSDGQVDVLESAAWAVNREGGTLPLGVSDLEKTR